MHGEREMGSKGMEKEYKRKGKKKTKQKST